MRYLDLAKSGLPLDVGVRVRVALDVLAATHGTPPPGMSRASVADLDIDRDGTPRLLRPILTDHLATLVWEILAVRVSDTNELPWTEPGADLPDEITAVMASLSVRPAKSVDDLRARFEDGARGSASPRARVAEVVVKATSRAPVTKTPVVERDGGHVTLRAPAMTAAALQTLRDEELAPPADSGPLVVAKPPAQAVIAEAHPKVATPALAPTSTSAAELSTIPYDERPVLPLARAAVSSMSGAESGRPSNESPGPWLSGPQSMSPAATRPRRRRSRVVALMLAAATVLIAIVILQRSRTATPSTPAQTAEATAPEPTKPPPVATESPVVPTVAPSTSIVTTSAPSASSSSRARPAKTRPTPPINSPQPVPAKADGPAPTVAPVAPRPAVPADENARQGGEPLL